MTSTFLGYPCWGIVGSGPRFGVCNDRLSSPLFRLPSCDTSVVVGYWFSIVFFQRRSLFVLWSSQHETKVSIIVRDKCYLPPSCLQSLAHATQLHEHLCVLNAMLIYTTAFDAHLFLPDSPVALFALYVSSQARLYQLYLYGGFSSQISIHVHAMPFTYTRLHLPSSTAVCSFTQCVPPLTACALGVRGHATSP